jgi:phosphoribosylaminoimidazole carboxylase PurE protein
MAGQPLAVIILGSKSDLDHGHALARALDGYGVASEIRVASAHKVTRYLLEMLEQYESRPEPRVYITVAGRSNALSGVVDANVAGPVIACPPYSDRYGGMDLLSSLRMPSGIAPLVVLETDAAALAAAKILALVAPEVASRLAESRDRLRAGALEDDRAVSSGGQR